jgi:hypothetical protein
MFLLQKMELLALDVCALWLLFLPKWHKKSRLRGLLLMRVFQNPCNLQTAVLLCHHAKQHGNRQHGVGA